MGNFLQMSSAKPKTELIHDASKCFRTCIYKSPFLVRTFYTEHCQADIEYLTGKYSDVIIFDVAKFHAAFDYKIVNELGRPDLMLIFDERGLLRSGCPWGIILALKGDPRTEALYWLLNILWGFQISGRYPFTEDTNHNTYPGRIAWNNNRSVLLNRINPEFDYSKILAETVEATCGGDWFELVVEATNAFKQKKVLTITRGNPLFDILTIFIDDINRRNKELSKQTNTNRYDVSNKPLHEQRAMTAARWLNGSTAEFKLFLTTDGVTDLIQRSSSEMLSTGFERKTDFFRKNSGLEVEVKSYRQNSGITLRGPNLYHNADYVFCLVRQYYRGPGKVLPTWVLLKKLSSTVYDPVPLDSAPADIADIVALAKDTDRIPDFHVELDKDLEQYKIYCLDRLF